MYIEQLSMLIINLTAYCQPWNAGSRNQWVKCQLRAPVLVINLVVMYR